MEAESIKQNGDITSSCPSGDDMITDSMGDILSSSTCSSSLTSLTADDTLAQMSTENESQNKSKRKSDENKPSGSAVLNFEMCSKDWYLHPMFNRFWKHYAHSIAWRKNHQSIIQNYRNKYHQNRKNLQQYQRHFQSRQKFTHSSSPSKKAKNKPTHDYHVTGDNPKQNKGDMISQDTSTCNDLSDADSEVYEMEVTEEMVEFFAKTQKHRKERDERKNSTSDKTGELKDIGQASKKTPTSEAPKERPGLRRTAEMTQIYGKGAAMIHGMETALQMTYDRNVDIKQPVCWPYMPLKIVFD